MTASVECPVKGGFCDNALCASSPRCASEADRILNLDPDKMEEEINTVAATLGLDTILFAEFVYDTAFGAGASSSITTDNPSPFSS